MQNLVKVIRTERIWMKTTPVLKTYSQLSKNLYNEANNIIRQTYFNEQKWVRTNELKNKLTDSTNYQ